MSVPSFEDAEKQKKIQDFTPLPPTPHSVVFAETSFTPRAHTPHSRAYSASSTAVDQLKTLEKKRYLRAALDADGFKRNSPEQHVERGLL